MKVCQNVSTGEITVTISRVEMETGEVCIANAAWRNSYRQFLRALSEEVDNLARRDESAANWIHRTPDELKTSDAENHPRRRFFGWIGSRESGGAK